MLSIRFFWNKPEVKYEAWIIDDYGVRNSKISELSYTKMYKDIQGAQHVWNYWVDVIKNEAVRSGFAL